MESEHVADQQVVLDAIVPFTKLTNRIPECVDKLLAISLDLQVPLGLHILLMSFMLME